MGNNNTIKKETKSLSNRIVVSVYINQEIYARTREKINTDSKYRNMSHFIDNICSRYLHEELQ